MALPYTPHPITKVDIAAYGEGLTSYSGLLCDLVIAIKTSKVGDGHYCHLSEARRAQILDLWDAYIASETSPAADQHHNATPQIEVAA